MFALGIVSLCVLGLVVSALCVLGTIMVADTVDERGYKVLIPIFLLAIILVAVPIVYIALSFTRLCS